MKNVLARRACTRSYAEIRARSASERSGCPTRSVDNATLLTKTDMRTRVPATLIVEHVGKVAERNDGRGRGITPLPGDGGSPTGASEVGPRRSRFLAHEKPCEYG